MPPDTHARVTPCDAPALRLLLRSSSALEFPASGFLIIAVLRAARSLLSDAFATRYFRPDDADANRDFEHRGILTMAATDRRPVDLPLRCCLSARRFRRHPRRVHNPPCLPAHERQLLCRAAPQWGRYSSYPTSTSSAAGRILSTLMCVVVDSRPPFAPFTRHRRPPRPPSLYRAAPPSPAQTATPPNPPCSTPRPRRVAVALAGLLPSRTYLPP